MAKKTEQESKPHKYSKEQLMASKKYQDQRDLLGALLVEGRLYTTDQVEKKINGFMKGAVK